MISRSSTIRGKKKGEKKVFLIVFRASPDSETIYTAETTKIIVMLPVWNPTSIKEGVGPPWTSILEC